MPRGRLIGGLFLLLALQVTHVQAEDLIDLSTRPGVTVRLHASLVSRPVASVLLFPGGNGAYLSVRNNFLIRIAPTLVQDGFSVIIVDVPSDHPAGMTATFRAGAEHAQDIGAVVDLAKSRAPVPVWLVGTSMGSVSAASGAAALGKRINGIILTSSVWMGGMAPVPLERIVVPVLVVHNRDDGCRMSPFGWAELAMPRLAGAPARQLLAASGGTLRGDECGGLSPHGYYGIEAQVVPSMEAWIQAH